MRYFRFVAWLIAVFSATAPADDGTPRVPLDITLGTGHEAVTRIAYEEALELRVDQTVVNDTDRPWAGLELYFEVYDFTRETFMLLAPDAATSFGRASLPLAAWREIFELRINNVYAGAPGGNWVADFGDTYKAMKIRFVQPLVHPRDRISIRFPVSRTPPLWRLRAVAIPASP